MTISFFVPWFIYFSIVFNFIFTFVLNDSLWFINFYIRFNFFHMQLINYSLIFLIWFFFVIRWFSHDSSVILFYFFYIWFDSLILGYLFIFTCSTAWFIDFGVIILDIIIFTWIVFFSHVTPLHDSLIFICDSFTWLINFHLIPLYYLSIFRFVSFTFNLFSLIFNWLIACQMWFCHLLYLVLPVIYLHNSSFTCNAYGYIIPNIFQLIAHCSFDVFSCVQF